MSGSILLRPAPAVAPLPPPPSVPVRLRENPARTRVWELSPTLHCSIVGTCLTAADLRQLFAKLEEPDARTATDHTLHGRAVGAVGKPGLAAKLINKALDRRHEVAIRRFAKARTAVEVRALWATAFARGEIPGGYWATLSHPASDRPLIHEVFGEVHMLSHLVGTANRADIVRLRQLEAAVAERDEIVARQQSRLAQAAAERAADRAAFERDLASRVRHQPVPLPPVAPQVDAERIRVLAERADAALAALHAAEARIAALEEFSATLAAETRALEATLDDAAAPEAPTLAGLTVLYVGGRPKLVEQLRAFCARQGGTLLAHDGGVEDSAALLPGLVSRADVALFPVDCVSHHAAEQVKRLCRQLQKPFVAVRSASVASFAAAVARLDLAAERCDCGAC